MASFFRFLREQKHSIGLWVHFAVATVVILLALALFVYPAVTTCLVVGDSQLRQSGQSRYVAGWFKSASGRYLSWANAYLDKNVAAGLDHEDVAATEWPMFGSVYFLVTAEELHKQGKIDATQGTVRRAVEKAAEIVASPVTATWVKKKWGDDYLERENVFYRMLLILGLSSYESITGDRQHHALMSEQRTSLAAELAEAKYHLLDDYPGECYPNDVLWAVAAIERAARLDDANHDELAKNLMAVLEGPLKTDKGLPAFQASARSGGIMQEARGCGNSGILLFAAELDPEIASRWFEAYETHFWKETDWMVGFTETARGSNVDMADVDSGPVLFEFGSVASGFAIGAAKTVGRNDRAAPLTMEAVACSWPTPFGPLVPGLMGRLGAGSWSLGEVALLFSMTRPCLVDESIPYKGRAPRLVWVLVAVYAGLGLFFIGFEIRSCRRKWRQYREANVAGGDEDGTDKRVGCR